MCDLVWFGCVKKIVIQIDRLIEIVIRTHSNQNDFWRFSVWFDRFAIFILVDLDLNTRIKHPLIFFPILTYFLTYQNKLISKTKITYNTIKKILLLSLRYNTTDKVSIVYYLSIQLIYYQNTNITFFLTKQF